MPLNIKDPDTERIVRELSAATGEGLTPTVRRAAEERLARVRGASGAEELIKTWRAISARYRALPDIDTRSDNEILGYDENGLPS